MVFLAQRKRTNFLKIVIEGDVTLRDINIKLLVLFKQRGTCTNDYKGSLGDLGGESRQQDGSEAPRIENSFHIGVYIEPN